MTLNPEAAGIRESFSVSFTSAHQHRRPLHFFHLPPSHTAMDFDIRSVRANVVFDGGDMHCALLPDDSAAGRLKHPDYLVEGRKFQIRDGLD